MMSTYRDYVAPLLWVTRELLAHNPFFIYGGREPLLHQTEFVAKALHIKPTRVLLADAIGLGKTVTALRTLLTLGKYRNIKRVLFAVPSALVGQWVEEAKSMGVGLRVIDRESLRQYLQLGGLPPGWYIGSMDTLKREEYLDVIERNRWDAIVVDEAHKLGMPGRAPNIRWQNIGDLVIKKNSRAIVLLLSATPHRGKVNDYLSRLALLDPTLLEVTNVDGLENVFDRREFYTSTHGVLLFRRTKEDVNKVYEQREVFKPCIMTSVLIVPNNVEAELVETVAEDIVANYALAYYGHLMNFYDLDIESAVGIANLLKTTTIKRGLSSPQALVKTFTTMIEKRGKIVEHLEKGVPLSLAREVVSEEVAKMENELDDLLAGDVADHEKELDDKFNEVAGYIAKFLNDDALSKLSRAVELAKKMLAGEVEDSKLETLKKIIYTVLAGKPEELPEEFKDLPSQKVIVFTEFKDTAYYLYSRLARWVEETFNEKDAVRVLTSDNKQEVDKIQKWLAEKGRRVLITTDVASEGLNLQHANVLVNYEITWSPVRLEQRVGRVWRYGQNRISYVFNLFLACSLEKEVSDNMFAKLYGITVSLGKSELIFGDKEKVKVYISTIRNELLEHAVGGKTLPGLMPFEVEFKGRSVALSEHRIISMLTQDAKAFVEAFISAMKKIMDEIERKNVLPGPADPEKLRGELHALTGFRDTVDAARAAKALVQAVAELSDASIEEADSSVILRRADGSVVRLRAASPESLLEDLLRYYAHTTPAKYYVYSDEEPKIVLLTEAKIAAGGVTRYSEPVAVVADTAKNAISVLRGAQLVETLAQMLQGALPVDEVRGLEHVLSWVQEVVKRSHNVYYEGVVKGGVAKILKGAETYEKTKGRVSGGSRYSGLKLFETGEPTVTIAEPVAVFISTAFFPETPEKLSEEVWMWAEDEAVRAVMEWERSCGREPVRVSAYEHYDVKSVKRDERGEIAEERYIEVKAKMGRSLGFTLTDREAEVARREGGRYWLYLVYGFSTQNPIILAIRNPIERLPIKKRVVEVKREEYVFKS